MKERDSSQSTNKNYTENKLIDYGLEERRGLQVSKDEENIDIRQHDRKGRKV